MAAYFENNDVIDAWLIKRRGKFTSSEVWKLLKDGVGRTSYIESRVIELSTKYYDRPELEEVEALRHGKVNEYPAYERYIHETKNHSMSYLGDETPMFIPCKKHYWESGGTPDIADIILEGDNATISYGCELKNPINPAYHFRRLNWSSQWDIKEGYPSCYCQIQDLIRVTGASGWDFVSHDDRQLYRSKQIVIINVKPDRKFIDNLELRIELAIKEKYKILSKHMGTEIKNRDEFIKLINHNG